MNFGAYYNFFSQFIHVYEKHTNLIKESIENKYDTVIDLCCGPGINTLIYQKSLEFDNFICIDSNTEYLEVAKKLNSGINNIKYYNILAEEYLNQNNNIRNSLIIIRGSYHFIENAISLDVFQKQKRLYNNSTIIIERSNLSAEMYPLKGEAKENLLGLTSPIRQRKFIQEGNKWKDFKVVSYGETENTDKIKFYEAVKSRSMSYLNDIEDIDLNVCISEYEGSIIPIYEEYVAYIYE
ncbi:class I SAM-dependent methyltransferase [Roseibium sp.]|uniref:class I SAM-dependent methyltransferase n=1 Tax=Roseibium sp. TaxID=1936156 RepID=UPI003A979A97